MIINPLQNGAILKKEWLQVRPRVTQRFAQNPQMYKPFGLRAHNGIDFGCVVGTPVFAPFDGVLKVVDSKKEGYGLHIKLRNSYKKLEAVLGHLSEVEVKTGDFVNQGQLLGLTGNTGFSTGPHLHFGARTLKESTANDVFKWSVENYDNGYFGYWDIEPYMLTWKGTLVHRTHKN